VTSESAPTDCRGIRAVDKWTTANQTTAYYENC